MDTPAAAPGALAGPRSLNLDNREREGSTLAGYHKGTPELRERAYETLLAHGGAMQNYELAELARRENWPIHHAKMWGTHGLLNTLREEGRVVRVSRGRYAVADHAEASLAGGWAAARLRIAATTRQTVAASGTVSRRRAKEKRLRAADLLAALDSLALKQGYRCAQTGVVFDEADPDLRASLDRIDSDGHYEDGSISSVSNLQLVTHWYNMAKGVRTDAEMARLLHLHGPSQDTHDRQTAPARWQAAGSGGS